MLFTIRTILNNLLDEPKHVVVVVSMISDMKEFLHFLNQLFSVAIYQSICTCHQTFPTKNIFNV